jgi:hypothetical protein
VNVEILFRLVVAGVLAVAPTVLFLGLWRGLMALRNDDLANRTLNGEFGRLPDGPIPTKVFRTAVGGGGSTDRAASPDAETVRCPHCGASNPRYVGYCDACLERLA